MKRILEASFIYFFLLLFVNMSATAQKTMLLDKDLIANSELIKVKAKMSVGYMSNWYINEFKFVSSKDGTVDQTESKDTLTVDGKPYREIYTVNGRRYVRKNTIGTKFEIDMVANRLEKINLTFSGPDGKEASAYYTFSQRYKASESNKEGEETSSSFKRITWIERSFTSTISGIGSGDWTLSGFQVYQKKIGSQFSCNLSNATDTIQVIGIDTWANGKKSKISKLLGFEFYYNGKSIGAIQGSENSMNKLAWIRNDLDEDMEMLIAVAELTLLGIYGTSHGL